MKFLLKVFNGIYFFSGNQIYFEGYPENSVLNIEQDASVAKNQEIIQNPIRKLREIDVKCKWHAIFLDFPVRYSDYCRLNSTLFVFPR